MRELAPRPGFSRQLVFVPVLTLEGIEGKLFRPMAWTFIFALAGALLTAVFLSPILSYYLLPRRAPATEGRIMSALIGGYGRVVAAALGFRRIARRKPVATFVCVSAQGSAA